MVFFYIRSIRTLALDVLAVFVFSMWCVAILSVSLLGGGFFFLGWLDVASGKKSVRNIDLYSLYSADSFIATP